MTLWRVFDYQVDPVIRMLHKPTFERYVIKAKDNIAEISKPLESLMFSVYFASITSMTEKQCRAEVGEERNMLVGKYRLAVQQSLARADVLSTHNLVTLQALVIFLVSIYNAIKLIF